MKPDHSSLNAKVELSLTWLYANVDTIKRGPKEDRLMTLQQMKELAEELAEAAGHDLEWNGPWHGEGSSVDHAQCTNGGCMMSLIISTRDHISGDEETSQQCPVEL